MGMSERGRGVKGTLHTVLLPSLPTRVLDSVCVSFIYLFIYSFAIHLFIHSLFIHSFAVQVLVDDDGTPEGHAHANKVNINVRAAFIHVIGDFIQSLGVLIAAYIIYYRVSIAPLSYCDLLP